VPPSISPEHRAATRHCRACWYDLKGLPLQGQCPECGTPYDREAQAEQEAMHTHRTARGASRRSSGWDWPRPSAWTAAILSIAIGAAAVLATFGYAAVHKLAYKMDPRGGCNGGGSGLPFR